MIAPFDCGEAARLHAGAFPPAEAWGRDAIALMLAMHGGFGVLHPGAGFVLARVVAEEAEILTLAVVPQARRAGQARRLLADAMAGAVLRGATRMFLEVSESNNPARMLYRTAGFAEIGRRRRYYADGSDALVLRCDLVEITATGASG